MTMSRYFLNDILERGAPVDSTPYRTVDQAATLQEHSKANQQAQHTVTSPGQDTVKTQVRVSISSQQIQRDDDPPAPNAIEALSADHPAIANKAADLPEQSKPISDAAPVLPPVTKSSPQFPFDLEAEHPKLLVPISTKGTKRPHEDEHHEFKNDGRKFDPPPKRQKAEQGIQELRKIQYAANAAVVPDHQPNVNTEGPPESPGEEPADAEPARPGKKATRTRRRKRATAVRSVKTRAQHNLPSQTTESSTSATDIEAVDRSEVSEATEYPTPSGRPRRQAAVKAAARIKKGGGKIRSHPRASLAL
ncbi:hypothetical protein BDV95DRAFT_663962 [Massariosphaeria phaeospora]|uniref:Uncharacterized protein n=1 Tax=Massariosphaeria phaeospora TaxID=100035 RepID=A0A7C8MMP8_9PLEO|nr:hypothetical protein BDV95DRAFT_663962 [Massariosphaeria phaeospora]